MASPATKPLLLLAAAAAGLAAAARRRQANADAKALWHEATADTAR